MSMHKCDGCNVVIDSDDFPDNWDAEGQFFCDPCIAKHETEGLELAAEHHRDLNAQGCTCRWNTSPDNGERYITRDENCPMHGIDPDEARDRKRDGRMGL